MKIIGLYLLIINAYAYLLMWQDKQAAITQRRRTPERRLLNIATYGGSLGIWLGTRAPLYHKRAKPTFKRPLRWITLAQATILALAAYLAYSRFSR